MPKRVGPNKVIKRQSFGRGGGGRGRGITRGRGSNRTLPTRSKGARQSNQGTGLISMIWFISYIGIQRKTIHKPDSR